MLRGWWVLVSGLLLVGAACARGRGGGAVEPANAPVRVEVTNHYALPIEIYAVGSGINHRMGIVYPGLAGHFVVPPNLIGGGAVVLVADPGRSGRLFRSGELLLAPGAVVDFEITAVLFNSTATIRP